MSDVKTTGDHDDNKFLWDQFCKLGEMIGDGLHLEPDGKWITKEYKQLSKLLIKPDKDFLKYQKEKRKAKNKIIDDQMSELLEKNPCSCGGKLKQSRSGSKISNCDKCGQRYKCKSVKKKHDQ